MNLPVGVNQIDELRADERVRTLRAQPPDQDDTVIIKLIELVIGDERASRADVSARLQAWRAIGNRAFVRPIHATAGANRLVIVLPDIATGSLGDRLSLGAVSSLDLGDLCQQACTALEIMHKAGHAHGNLKPNNILIDVEGNLLLTDPLLVPEIGRRAPSSYQAPEQARGAPPTPAADQYSLALILLSLLTGQPPDQAARVLANMAINGPLGAAGRSGSDPFLPAKAVHVLRKALTSDPANRWPSVAEFSYAFQTAMGYQAVAPRRTGPEPAPQPEPRARSRKRRPWAVAGPALAVFLCAVLAVPAFSFGWVDQGLALLSGPAGGPVFQQSGSDLQPAGFQATPTINNLTLGEQDPSGLDPTEPALDPGSLAFNELIEPTKAQVGVALPPAYTATSVPPQPTRITAQQPIATATPVPINGQTGGGSVNPNSCKSDPGHPRYCTPTPGP